MKKILSIGIILLFFGLSITPISGISLDKQYIKPISNGNTLYVGGSGPGNYTKIQDAIDNSSDGDTVYVFDDSSPYYESVKVDKSIYLIGENKDTTIIDGNKIQDFVVNISAEYVILSDFTIQNASMDYETISGVYITANYVSLDENIITENPFGLYCDKVDYNNISNNIFTKNDNAILMLGCNNSIVWNNIISENTGYGIDYGSTYNCIFSRNTITKNENGISTLWSGWFGFKNIISYNTISENEIFGVELRGSKTDVINNNFMNNGRNAYFSYGAWEFWFNGGFSKFNGNYWDRSRTLPKPIFGLFTVAGYIFKLYSINMFHLDRNPAQVPYDIGM